MSDRPTPNTDVIALVIAAGDWVKESDCTKCALDFARDLERERDEAKRVADYWQAEANTKTKTMNTKTETMNTKTKGDILAEQIEKIGTRLNNGMPLQWAVSKIIEAIDEYRKP